MRKASSCLAELEQTMERTLSTILVCDDLLGDNTCLPMRALDLSNQNQRYTRSCTILCKLTLTSLMRPTNNKHPGHVTLGMLGLATPSEPLECLCVQLHSSTVW